MNVLRTNRLLCLSAVVSMVLSHSTSQGADSKGPVYTDAANAGPDYALQGEYEGVVQTADGEKRFGAQVIALGDHRFQAVGFYGGLPGAGWKRGDKVTRVEGTAVDGKLTVETEGAIVEIADGKAKVKSEGKLIGTLQKTKRSSPTLGAKPPADAVVLFDGSSADAFVNGQMVDGKWLAASNCASKEKFGDHHLHIEFRTPFMPQARGQARGNSGVYIQSRYELQVLDSFGLDGKDNECGGIYSVSEPIVNMCLPPLAWQTYDIDFTAARYDDSGNKVKNAQVTISHNGVVIHEDRVLPHGTPGRNAEGVGPDALFLQNHGNPVVFRNIWVTTK